MNHHVRSFLFSVSFTSCSQFIVLHRSDTGLNSSLAEGLLLFTFSQDFIFNLREDGPAGKEIEILFELLLRCETRPFIKMTLLCGRQNFLGFKQAGVKKREISKFACFQVSVPGEKKGKIHIVNVDHKDSGTE